MKNYVCENCYESSTQEEWNKATKELLKNITLIQDIPVRSDGYLDERWILFDCPKCSLINNSQFISMEKTENEN